MSNKEKEIDLFKEKVKKDAEELVLKKFPQKILDLNVLSNSKKFSPNYTLKPLEINIPVPPPKSQLRCSDVSQTKSDNKITDKDLVEFDDELIIVKPHLFPNGRIESNKEIIEMIEELKPRMIELSEDILLTKLGLNLMVPKIEDGNNFGVEIQREAIDALTNIENEILSDFDKFESYYENRGDRIVKVAKYPHNNDFRIAVQEYDQRFYLDICLILTDIRNHYMNLHDLFTKNINKIKEPKSSDNKDLMLY